MYSLISCQRLGALALLFLLLVGCGAPAQPAEAPQTTTDAASLAATTQPASKAATAQAPSTTTLTAPATNVLSNQTLTVAIATDPGILNPHSYEAGNMVALSMVYEPLVRYTADGTLQPALAESWTISDDGLRWTFKLRQGVSFSDGTPFDAAAAKWNLERWVGVKDHSWLASSSGIQSIETPDAHTLVMTLTTFSYAALQELSLVRPVRFGSPKAADAQGQFTQPVGTGPWTIDEYVADQRLVFAQNPSYWGTKSAITKVVFEVTPDPQTRVAALQSGDVDLIGGEYLGGIPLESIATLESDPDVKVFTESGSTSYMIQMNPRRAPFDDVVVRRALNHAIDRDAISQHIFRGLATPAAGIFPTTIPYVTHPHPEFYTFAPEEAQTLLDQAGWTMGADGVRAKDGQPLAVSLIFAGDVFPQAKSMAEVIQSELKDIGIAVTATPLESGAYYDTMGKGEYDLAINLTWGAPYDPFSSLSALFRSTEGSTGSFRFYTSPALDTLIDRALAASDEEQRRMTYVEIWNMLDDNAAAAPVVYSQRVYAARAGVHGFQPAGTEYELDLTNVTVDPQE